MTDQGVEVVIDQPYAASVATEWVQRVVRAVLTAEQQPGEVTVYITGDETVRELNRQYAHTDETTDVLSFAAREGADFVGPAEAQGYLGDIVISYPRAAAQAAERGETVSGELALVIVHGCLHLLGYDHAEDAERTRMWARQEAILKGLDA